MVAARIRMCPLFEGPGLSYDVNTCVTLSDHSIGGGECLPYMIEWLTQTVLAA